MNVWRNIILRMMIFIKWVSDMGANYLKPTVRGYRKGEVYLRYLREETAAELYGYTVDQVVAIAYAASAVYQLPKIRLINRQKVEEYMKHLAKVPGTNKTVNKVFVKPGEGMILYSIGRNRFIDMARAAGAVYKLSDGMILIHLETFDNYMEQFHQKAVPLKKPLGEEK